MNREINIQNQILNFVRKDRSLITLFLVSGKKFVGQVVGFDRYTIHVRGRDYDQIVFKHAITNISVPRHVMQKMQGNMDRSPEPAGEGSRESEDTGDFEGFGVRSGDEI
ncbi:MAG: RNA chaperone Hfq [Acidobacteriota bacterium]|jgi:host factor-I protein